MCSNEPVLSGITTLLPPLPVGAIGFMGLGKAVLRSSVIVHFVLP